MTAVIRPVGVEHSQLGEAWIAFFFVAEIGLAEFYVLNRHCKGEIVAEGGGVLGCEVGEDRDISGWRGDCAVRNRGHGDFV